MILVELEVMPAGPDIDKWNPFTLAKGTFDSSFFLLVSGVSYMVFRIIRKEYNFSLSRSDRLFLKQLKYLIIA